MSDKPAGVRRNFVGPSGRHWSVELYHPGSDRVSVRESLPPAILRFTSEDVVLELQDYPSDWLALPEDQLVTLARKANPPRI